MSKNNSIENLMPDDTLNQAAITAPDLMLPPKFVAYHPVKSIRYASEGLLLGFQREANLRLQFSLGIASCAILMFFHLYLLALGTLMMMFITMGAELFNTAIETLCDLLHPDFHPKIKIVKDMAAAAVWMASLAWLTVLIYGFYSIVTPFFINL
ncbi:MAG: hypothetical protein OHK0017_09770 [Patescibacteria group bacterium]